MKVLFIHNKYFKTSGEEISVKNLIELLLENGHYVETYFRSSAEMEQMKFPRINAFISSIKSNKSIKEIDEKIENFKPDIVQIQNIYPFISPAIFQSIKEKNIPIVMRTPNYRLFCPNGLFMRPDNRVCEKCTGVFKELNCIMYNCESTILKSTSYAIRNFIARIRNSIVPNVDMFIVQSEFQKRKFILNNINEEKIGVLPGFIQKTNNSAFLKEGYVLFVGRMSAEKGIDIFIKAAKLLPHIKFAIAGTPSADFDIHTIPQNVKLYGFLKEPDLIDLHLKTSILVVPSLCYEGFPNVIVRAMSMGIPVIASRIGVLEEIINKTECGILYTPSLHIELAKSIEKLYGNDHLLIKYGEKALESYNKYYTKSTIYNELMKIYSKAILNNKNI